MHNEYTIFSTGETVAFHSVIFFFWRATPVLQVPVDHPCNCWSLI
jgi:hypothetical protein